MPPSGDATRRRILDAAEQLLQQRGIDRVSLRAVNAASGARNKSAVQYHFGDEAGLLDAIVARHQAEVDRHRLEMLDELGDEPVLREIVAALVEPLAAKLDDERGRNYLRIQARRLGDRERVPLYTWQGEGLVRIAQLADRAVEPRPPAIRDVRGRLVSTMLVHGLADYATTADPHDPRHRRTFVETLIDSITAMLAGQLDDAPNPKDHERGAVR